MLSVFAITLPIFLLIALGYLATRFGVTNRADIRGVGIFVVRFALPMLVFRSLSQRDIGEIVNTRYLLAYGAASLLAFALVFGVTRFGQRRSVPESAFAAMGSSLSNSSFIGFPVAALALGPVAVVALALSMIIESMIILPLTLMLAESDGHPDKSLASLLWHIAKRLARTPLIQAICCGLLFSLAHIHVPAPLFKAIDMLATASTAAALFAVGGALAGITLHGMIGDVAKIVSAKLFLHPLLVFITLLLVPGLDPTLKKAMLIIASAPSPSILPLIAQPYGQEDMSAAALTASTALSFLTMSGMLMLL